MDLRPQKSRKPAAGEFQVGGGTPQPLLRRRELWLVFLMVVVVLLVLSYVSDLLGKPAPGRGPVPEEQVDLLEAMPLPDLAEVARPALDPLPERDRATLDLLFEKPELVRKNLFGPSPLCLAWLEERLKRDAEQTPIFQRFASEDLLRGLLPVGTSFLCDGQLVDLSEQAGAQWAVVALGPEFYALVRANTVDDDVVIGEQVRLAGRYLGREHYGEAVEDRNGDQVVDEADRPVISFLGVDRLIPKPPELPLAEAIALPKIGVDGNIPPEDDIWDEIDDIYPSLEIRPYYYLLGVVSRNDRYKTEPYAGAKSLVGKSIAIHNDPSLFRGDPMRFQGYVLYSFEDSQVARDQPFGIERVLRIVCWNTIWGPYKERDVEGNVSTKMAWVRQAYELAVISDQPAPPRGAFIQATGRFLKVHGVPAKANWRLDDINDVTRQSDNVYFKFMVCNEYVDSTPAEIDWGPLRLAFLILVPLTLLWIVYLEITDNRKQLKRPERVRRLRKTRQALGLDQKAEEQAAKDAAQASPEEEPPV